MLLGVAVVMDLNAVPNRPWWPRGLSHHVSNSSRDRGQSQVRIPARDYDIDRSEVEILCRYSYHSVPGDVSITIFFVMMLLGWMMV